METGQRGLKPDDVSAVLGFLRAPAKQRETLLRLTRDSKGPNWVLVDKPLPTSWNAYLRLEDEAAALNNYEPLGVPGLLQTADYARAVISAAPKVDPGLIDELVNIRMKRRALLGRRPTTTMNFIVDETVLRRPIGGPDVMSQQLQRMLAVASLPSVSLRVIPFAVGAHPGVNGSFVIMEFVDHNPILYTETRGPSGFLEERQHIANAWTDWRELRRVALSPVGSAELIKKIIAEFQAERNASNDIRPIRSA